MIRWFVLILPTLAAWAQASTAGEASEGASYATILDAPPCRPIKRLGPESYTPTLTDKRWRFANSIEERRLPMLCRLEKSDIGNFFGIEWSWRDEDTAFATSEPPPPGQTEWRKVMRKPSKAGSLQRTHTLVAYGIGVEDIEKLRRAGFDAVTAIEDMSGRQTLEKRAMTATDIVIAEPVGINLRDPGPGGFFSSVRWRVIKNIKGDTSPGTELRQRMASGERANKAGEFVYGQGMDASFLIPGLPQSLDPGSRWALHLNDALYRHMAHVNGGEGTARTEGDWYISTPGISPTRIDEEGRARHVTIEELRTRIRPIQQAYRVKEQQVR